MQKQVLAEVPETLASIPRPLHDRTLVSLENAGLVDVYRQDRKSFWRITDQGKTAVKPRPTESSK